jgi:hypothetical protein
VTGRPDTGGTKPGHTPSSGRQRVRHLPGRHRVPHLCRRGGSISGRLRAGAPPPRPAPGAVPTRGTTPRPAPGAVPARGILFPGDYKRQPPPRPAPGVTPVPARGIPFPNPAPQRGHRGTDRGTDSLFRYPVSPDRHEDGALAISHSAHLFFFPSIFFEYMHRPAHHPRGPQPSTRSRCRLNDTRTARTHSHPVVFEPPSRPAPGASPPPCCARSPPRV